MTLGGHSGHPLTVESRHKISLKQSGRKLKECTKQKISEYNRGSGNPFAGRTHSAASKTAQREQRLGIPMGEEHKRKAKMGMQHEYEATSPDGKVYHFRGMREFCNEHNLAQSSMNKICRGKCHQYKGWACRIKTLSKRAATLLKHEDLESY